MFNTTTLLLKNKSCSLIITHRTISFVTILLLQPTLTLHLLLRERKQEPSQIYQMYIAK